MCGLFGYYSLKDNVPERGEISTLAITSSIRGTDAVGVAHGEVIAKKSRPAVEAIESILPDVFEKYLMGHTRAATKGSKEIPHNNHPIKVPCQFGNIIFAHNGVIDNDDELFSKYGLPRTGQVDSEIIGRLIAHFLKGDSIDSMIEAIAETSKKLRGSLAVTVYTSWIENTLFLFRRRNPLCIAMDPTRYIVFYASTDDIIEKSFKQNMNSWFEEEQEKLSVEHLIHKPRLIFNKMEASSGIVLAPSFIKNFKLPEQPIFTAPHQTSWTNPYNISSAFGTHFKPNYEALENTH